MNVITGSDEVCIKIAEALGIKHCRFLEINMSVGAQVSVKAEFYLEKDNVKSLIPILQEYRLIEKER